MRNTNNYELDTHFKYDEWKKEIPLRKVNRDLKSVCQEIDNAPQKLKNIGVENTRL